MIAFGRAYIANPDLVERFERGWPVAHAPDTSVWYVPPPPALCFCNNLNMYCGAASGYTDFTVFTP